MKKDIKTFTTAKAKKRPSSKKKGTKELKALKIETEPAFFKELEKKANKPALSARKKGKSKEREES